MISSLEEDTIPDFSSNTLSMFVCNLKYLVMLSSETFFFLTADKCNNVLINRNSVFSQLRVLILKFKLQQTWN